MPAAAPGAASALTHVFRWDLDKTYLRTDFDSFRDLVKSAFEKAIDKQAVPGAPALLRALKQAGGARHRVCIISGSPEQMRTVLTAKLELDGVEFDEFILKDNLRNLIRGRFRALRAQVPYKLPALLASRVALVGDGADQADETLFGDDAESDALIYSLYADLTAGRLARR
jgi:phosphatidate phosphatase APP1